MTRPPDPDSPAGRNLRRSQDAGEAMRFFTARRLRIPIEDVHYVDMISDEIYLVEILTALRHWAAGFAADYAKADRRAKAAFMQHSREEHNPAEPPTGKER